MARESRFSSNDPAQRLQALSRWDNEGGAIPVGPFVNPASGEMAGYISPRPGFRQHPLTIHAAAHMVDLVERSLRFRTKVP